MSAYVQLFFGFVASRAVGMAASVALTVLTGRLLGPAGLGQWSLIVAGGMLMHGVLISWTHASTVRYGCEEWTRGRSLAQTFWARVPLVAAGVLTSVALIAIAPDAVGRWFGVHGRQRWLIGCYAAAVWLTAEAQATLQATNQLGLLAVLTPLVGLGSVAAILTLSALNLITVTAFVSAVVAVQVGIWGTLLAIVLGRAKLTWRPSVLETRRHVRFAWPQIPALGLGFVSDWGDHLLLSAFTTVAQVGFFGVAYQMLQATLNVNSILSTILLPKLIAKQVASPGATRYYVDRIAPTLFALWVLAANWGVAVLPPVLLLLMGDRFRGALPFVLVLAVVIPSHVVTSLYSMLFTIQERLGRTFVYSVALTISNVIVSIALIPRIGPIGAAIGSAASYAVGQILYIWDQHRFAHVAATRIWILLAVTLGLGVGQVVIGPALLPRVAWAAFATVVVIAVTRRARLVDAEAIGVCFAGRFASFGALAVRVFTAVPVPVAVEERPS